MKKIQLSKPYFGFPRVIKVQNASLIGAAVMTSHNSPREWKERGTDRIHCSIASFFIRLHPPCAYNVPRSRAQRIPAAKSRN